MIKFSTLFIVVFCFYGYAAPAQPGHFREVVLEIRNYSAGKQNPLLNNALKTSQGESHVAAVCEANGWVVLALDLQSGITDEQLLLLLKSTGISFILKEQATLSEVTAACNGPLLIQ